MKEQLDRALARLAQLKRRREDIVRHMKDLERELKEIDRDGKVVADAIKDLEAKHTPAAPAKVK